MGRLGCRTRNRIWRLAALAALAAVPAWAGPWLQKRGHGLAIASWRDYRAGERFSLTGAREPLGAGGVFRAKSLHIWTEVGLTERWTGILSGSVQSLRYQDPGYRASTTAPGDIEAGLRRGLRVADSGWQVSAQMLVKAPGYSSHAEPRPGNGQADLEGSLLTGRSFPVGSRWGFVSLEAGYRKRWGRPGDQYRAEASGGIHWNQRLTLTAQSFAIRRAGALPAASGSRNPLIEPVFDLYKIQVSAIVRLAPGWSVQTGYGQDFAGRNIGRGRQWIVALWKTF